MMGTMKRSLRFALMLLLVMAVDGCAGLRPPKGVAPIRRSMTVTAYCNCKKCCGWRRNWYLRPVYASGPSKGKRKKVGVTAAGTKAKPGTIAADTSKYPFGTIMFVPGYGYGRVEDRGGAIKGEHIDIFFKKHSDAMEWGRQEVTVSIWLPKD